VVLIGRSIDEEFFNERAGILEFDAGHPRSDAELLAALAVLKRIGK